MNKINQSIKFFIDLSKAQTILSSRFDRGLGGLSFNEFLVLFYLDNSENKKMRRIDIAEKIGLTASGITRILLPMEKVRLVKSGPAENDARVRFVELAPGGQEQLMEALKRLEILAEEIIPKNKDTQLDNLAKLLVEISGRTLMI